MLTSLSELRKVMSDPNCSGVSIDFRGEWSYEKLGRIRSDFPPIAQSKVEDIHSHLKDGFSCVGEWFIHSHLGSMGVLLVFERRPSSVLERLSNSVSSHLRNAIRLSGDGMLVGPVGCKKSSILCWLAAQITNEPLLYISEVPPMALPGKHIRHVFPPQSHQDRRMFERLIRVSSIVLWDRIASPEDYKTLTLNLSAKKRWFTIDAPNPRAALVLVNSWGLGTELKLGTIFTMSRSTIGRSEPESLLVLRNGKWVELFRSDDMYLDLFKGSQSTRPRLSFSKSQSTSKPNRAHETLQIDPVKDFMTRTGVISENALNILVEDRSNSHKALDNLLEDTRQYSTNEIIGLETNSEDFTEERRTYPKTRSIRSDAPEIFSEAELSYTDEEGLDDYSSVVELDEDAEGVFDSMYKRFSTRRPMNPLHKNDKED